MNNDDYKVGQELYHWCEELFPINRSLMGDGVRETLRILKRLMPELQLKSVPSGYQAFDWLVPNEWFVRDAWLKGPNNDKIINFNDNNLHLVGYSVPVNRTFQLNELKEHLYYLPEMPQAIPYITSYYKPTWGFCMSYNQFNSLADGTYEVLIDSGHFPGELNYGEILLPSTENNTSEIFLSTYICHPSMANNELSGPVVTIGLARWLSALKTRKFNYRIVFVPETLGPLVYMSKHLPEMKANMAAGFNVTCIGDEREYSYLPSRKGDTLSDKAAKHVLKWIDPTFKSYAWSQRGSDERQYCSPGADLPVACIMRTKWAEYPEYHSSEDTLGKVVTADGLEGGFNALRLALEAIEYNIRPSSVYIGEPKLDKYGLYPTVSKRVSSDWVPLVLEYLTWSDGSNDLFDIADKCNVPIWNLYALTKKLMSLRLIEVGE